MKPQHQEILEKYIYKKQKPLFSNNNYSVWQGTQTESNIPVTIKVMKFPHIELPKYLKKLKEIKSEFVIKIFEVTADQSTLMIITEQVSYGTLKKALQTCEHLDQNDSAFISKVLLNGHVDLLRADLNWFGTQDDIEFTDSGLKLSWNNSCQYNLINPFPTIMTKLTSRIEAAKSNSLLPFPEIKSVNQLIKVCKENASEISLHPQMKQKIKFSKRKGKDWMGLREVKSKNEYFDQLSYLAISKQFGFVRVKIYEAGKISPNLLLLNKTKSTFTKVIDVYDQGEKTIIISEYSNDGNLQAYIKRLKSAGISLKQQHIQFFFYSLFEPIKNVQQSTLKSISMLHIKNIYIENGIPKIGEPIPMNAKINQIMADRSDVPDFYHKKFKMDSSSRAPQYDTYSLGVLLYKLMYTEYPIFIKPNEVHIPTSPNYNKRLKTSIQIFLNQGGSLSDLEKKIQISENVLKQIKQNKQKLVDDSGKGKEKKKIQKKEEKQSQESQEDKVQTISKISIVQEEKNEEVESEESSQDQEGICFIIGHKLKLKPAQKMKQTYPFLDILQESPYRKCRLWTKNILILLLYLFVFFYTFLANDVALITDQNLLQTIPITISGTSYNIITSNYYSFTSQYNSLPQTISSLQSMGCGIDGYSGQPYYSQTVYNNSTIWITYIIGGLLTVLLMLFFKVIQINLFDEIKAWNCRQNGIGKFNMFNYIIVLLSWQTLLAGHFFLFNFIYYSQTQPCLGFPKGVEYGSTVSLFSSTSTFMNVYVAVYISQLIFLIIYFIVIYNNQNINYNLILNPITTLGVGFMIFAFIVRFGFILNAKYYPSAANDSSGIIKAMFSRGDVKGIFGVFPEIILVIELIISFIVDLLFWVTIDKSHSLLSNDASVVNDGLNDLV